MYEHQSGAGFLPPLCAPRFLAVYDTSYTQHSTGKPQLLAPLSTSTKKWVCVMEIQGEKHREKLNYIKVAFGKLKIKSALGRTVIPVLCFSLYPPPQVVFFFLLCHHRSSRFLWSCLYSMSKTAEKSQLTSMWTSTTLLSEK